VVCWYDRRGHHALWLTGGDAGPQIVVASQDSNGYSERPSSVDVSTWAAVHLRVEVDHRHVRFGISPDGSAWLPAGQPLETVVVSDDYPGPLRFTGPMVGLAAVDSSDGTFTADFTACVETRRHRG
jgi:beta-xylosidase